MENDGLTWQHRRGSFNLLQHGLIMGVLNVTPDSFSDGGCYTNAEQAVARVMEMVSEGAAVIDVGGESTRPGAEPVEEAEELRRVIPVIRGIRAASDVVISIDTSKAVVADEALQAGADIINDVTAFRKDPSMAAVAHAHKAGVVLMHMRGVPSTMQTDPVYEDVVAEVANFLRQRMEALLETGMDRQAIVLDPGIGFGKTPQHNSRLLGATGTLVAIGRPLLIGVSRKSYLGWLTASGTDIAARHWPGVALTSYCRELGARIFRVHDPAPHVQAMRMTEAILAAGAAPRDIVSYD